MQCPDCGELRHPKLPCIEYELDIWFFQIYKIEECGDIALQLAYELDEYGEWIFDCHCTLLEFLEANEIELEDAVWMHTMCKANKDFTVGGGAAPLHLVMPSRPTIH